MPPLRRLLRLALRRAPLTTFFAAAAIAANQPPERFLAFPDLTLPPGADAVVIPLADHVRDPDVPGTAVRVTVRIGATTRAMDLALYDAQAPATVANFVAYVDSGRYNANFIHRSMPGFVLQNGGFYFVDDTHFDYVPTYAPVVNEPGISNVRGTIAMAKLGGDPNSATSQWFINLADNSANLDAQNGGFTVFGRVLGDGMSVADDIAAVTRYNASGVESSWTDLPLTVGALARANFIETSAALIPALSHQVVSGAPAAVAATLDAGSLRITPAADRTGTAAITLTTTDLEGGQLVSTFTVTVPGQAQTITFAAPSDRTYGDAPFTPTATSSSGLPVALSVASGPATLDANGLLTLTGAGVVTLRATQPGSAIYLEASPIERSFTVAKAGASVALSDLSQTYSSAPRPITATTTPGDLAISVTYDGSATPPTLPGTYAIAATITDANYAGSATGTLIIAPAAQTISFAAPSDRAYGDDTLAPSATADSGLPVAFSVVSGPATLDEDGLLTLTGVGVVTLRATQPGDANYLPATAVERSFTVSAAPSATLALGNLARTYDGSAHTPSATTTPAGLAVTYLYGPAPGSPVPPVHAGSYAVSATLDDPRASNRPVATGTLVIAKAPLTARAPVVTRAVTRPNPALAVAYEGFAPGDTPAGSLSKPPVLATKAAKTSAPGVYPITLTGGASADYALTLVPGSVTVVGYGGSFEALVLDDDDLPVGKLSLSVPAGALTYTGTLALAAEADSVSVKGELAPASDFLSATHTFVRSATTTRPALSLSFTLSAATLTGVITRADAPLGTLAHGARLAPPAAPLGNGAHTLLLTAPTALLDAGPAAPPSGAGHATASLAASTATLALSGKLPDGATLTASLKPAADRSYRLWVNPYAKHLDSFLAGRLALAAHPETARFPGRYYIPGEQQILVWKKTGASTDKSYRAGFGPLALDVALDPWLPPAAAKAATKTAPAQPAVTLAQRLGLAETASASGAFSVGYHPVDMDLGALATSLPVAASLSASGVVAPAAPLTTPANATQWKLAVKPATGAFTGSFVLKDIVPPATKPTSRTVSFSGVLRQAPADDTAALADVLGAGVFLVPGFAVPKGAAPAEQASGEIRLTTP